MSVFATAYQTAVCKSHVMKKTIEAVETAHVDGSLECIVEGVWCVYGRSNFDEIIPSYAHPLQIKDRNKHDILVSDMRTFGVWDSNKYEFRIRNQTDYNLQLYRTKLNYLWLVQDINILRDISTVPVNIFASWISESVSRKYGLDAMEQYRLAIASAILYYSNFNHDNHVDDREKLRLATVITRNIRVKAEDVLELLDRVPVFTSVEDFCEKVADLTGSIRLQDLNLGMLVTILGSTWFGGINSQEIVGVALEHPPTWISILLAAYTDRSFHNSAIGKLTDRQMNKNEGERFVRAIKHTLEHAFHQPN